jgi:hypothetical protein
MKLSRAINWKIKLIPGEILEKTTQLYYGIYKKGSPKICIVAGIHGDEGPWGVYAINKLLEITDTSNINGSISILPVANPKAFQENSRVASMDHLDLNRVFPGDPKGSYTQRVAAVIAENIIEDSDYIVDLHGGGSWCVNAFGFEFEGSEKLARVMNPPFLLKATGKDGSLSNYAKNNGKQVTALEMGGKAYFEKDYANEISKKLWNALVHTKILDEEKNEFNYKCRYVGPSSVLRPDYGGLFIPDFNEDKVGKVVGKNEILGKVVDPVNFRTLEKFISPYDRTAILLLRPRITLLEGGAMTYVVSPLIEGDK